jgi:hypothetical protein
MCFGLILPMSVYVKVKHMSFAHLISTPNEHIEEWNYSTAHC